MIKSGKEDCGTVLTFIIFEIRDRCQRLNENSGNEEFLKVE